MADKQKKEKTHPWRKCSTGKHWVSAHPRRSKSNKVTIVDGHCRLNRSKKDQIYSDELILITNEHFEKVSFLPTKDNLGYKWLGNKYDHYIAGWTKYWNEVLAPDEPLDPNLVKALIATESSFKKDGEAYAGKRAGKARGLMQVTDWALEILADEKGEIRNHLINVDQKEMYEPTLNIAAGTRWLFRKKETASSKLKRKATWMEAAADYKSYLEDWRKDPKHKQMNKLINYYERLKK